MAGQPRKKLARFILDFKDEAIALAEKIDASS